ncbi:MAG: YqaJ viral recombinase family protein [Dokdonella sp.]
MKILQVTQGSAEWSAIRAKHFTASEAPALMGASKYQTRQDLMHQKATGLVPEVDAHKQALFDRGHAAEAAARVIVEEMIGEDLFPATAVHDGGLLLASFDGITMLETILYECKLWNEGLVAQVRAGELEPHYFWQLEQQLLVSGAEKVIFVCSDGTREKFVSMEYRAVPGRAEQLIAAWRQFEVDLAAYVPPAAAAVEKIVAETVEALPAPVVQVSGQLTLQDNFRVFEDRLRHFLEHKLIRESKTDQDFVDLDAQIKAMKQAREALGAAEAQMLAQVEPVDRAKKTKDMLDKLLQQNLSMAERMLKDEKERRCGEIVGGGIAALREHVAALNARLGENYMPAIPADFGGCVKGLKSLASMEDRVSGELARCKIAANETADRIQVNMRALVAAAGQASFPDAAALVLKDPGDLNAIISQRVAETERKLAEQRERIRAEEQAKAEKAAREKVEAEQRQAAEDAKPALPPAAAPIAHPALATPAGNVSPLRSFATAGRPVTPPTLRLGQIGERLGFAVTADFLRSLGFEAAAKDKSALLFHESDFPRICASLISHIQAVMQQREAA